MAKFLNTSATTYVLEQLISKAQKRVVLISPYLKFNKRIKQQIEDKASQGIQFDIVYGKSELKDSEKAWLLSIETINLYFCQDLHAKCYLNESSCIITSMNLYEFSQVNNDEMGLLITAKSDPEAFVDAANEALRLIRVAQKQEAPAAKPVPKPKAKQAPVPASKPATDKKDTNEGFKKITTSALAKNLKLKTGGLVKSLKAAGYIVEDNGMDKLTEKAIGEGCEFRKGRTGYYFLWPKDFDLNKALSD